MHWEVQVSGDSGDLRMLSDSLRGGEVQLVESAEGCVLCASEFESLDSAGLVRDCAIEIVTVLSGSARLALGARKSIGVGAVYRVRADGKRDITVFLKPAVIRLGTLPMTLQVTGANGTTQVKKPADPVSRWLTLARKDPAVTKALRLRDAGELSWVDLCRLYEVIEGDVGRRMHDLGWATRNELERFTRTANSVGAVGDQARHGKDRSPPPPQPMSLSHARELIDRLLRSWLALKTAPMNHEQAGREVTE
jgi:hypothetical protein